MRVSDKGIEFIKREEGLRLTAYDDIAGNITLGYGHLVQPDDDLALTITEEEAEKILRVDLEESEHSVDSLVKVPLEQHQFDALSSWTFNLGHGNLKRSTLLKKLNAGLYSEVPKQMLRWVYAGDQNQDGVVNYEDRVAGLVKRRQREGKLLAVGDYGVSLNHQTR